MRSSNPLVYLPKDIHVSLYIATNVNVLNIILLRWDIKYNLPFNQLHADFSVIR